MPERLLIFGGTTEAADLAARLVERFGDRVEVTTSLAGRLPPGRPLAGQVRVGGFGGADGIAAYVREHGIDAVVDATHPFAEAIARHVHAACAEAGVPRLKLWRPPWRPEPGDAWTRVDGYDGAARALAGRAERVFLAIGSQRLGAFAGLDGIWFLVRTFAPPPAPPLPACEVVVQRPPFTGEGERALMARHRIDTLVVKESGGPTGAKLAAARELGVGVVMIRRPVPPPGETVETVDQALDWVSASA